MRKRLYLTCGLLMAGALAGSLVRAQTNAAVAGTSDNAPTLDLDRSEECIEQMKQLQQTVADLEAAATRSNLLVRAECIR